MDRRTFIGSGLAALPLLLGRTPLAAWAGGDDGGPSALATADRQAHVVAVALATGRVRARIGTRADPRSIECRGAGPAVVAHSAEGVVSLIDGSALRVRRVLGGFQAPRYTAIAPNGALAYVSDSGSGEVAVVDLVAGRVVRRVEVGAAARHLAIAPDGGALWVSLGSSAPEIVVVDLRRPRHPVPVRRIRPPFLAHDVGFTPSGRRVWVTAGREAKIAVYAASGREPLRTLTADAAPQHVAFAGGRAYVASGNGRSVRVHRLADGVVLRTTKVPFGSYNVQAGAGRVLTPSLGTGALTVLDAGGRPVEQVWVAQAAHDVCVVG